MRPLSDLANFKAMELRNVFFYCLLPNIQDILLFEQMTHLSLYIYAQCDCSVVKRCFFNEDHELFYYNFHNFVLHLHAYFSMIYKDHGSLANIGCFAQEDLIGSLSCNHHRSRYYGELIMHYFNIEFWFHNKQRSRKSINGPIDPSPSPASEYKYTLEFHSSLICDCVHLNSCIVIYHRFIVRQQIYHSLIYTRRRNSISYFVEYCSANDIPNRRFGSIKYFFVYENEGYAVFDTHSIRHDYSDFFRASKYYGLLKDSLNCVLFVLEKNSRRTEFVKTDFIINDCIVIDMNDALLITPVQNCYEHD